MGDVKTSGLCGQHGSHCKAIEYLEKGQDEIKEQLRTKTIELKDTRKSIIHDFERFEDFVKSEYVRRTEFALTQKLVYGIATLMVVDAIRRIIL